MRKIVLINPTHEKVWENLQVGDMYWWEQDTIASEKPLQVVVEKDSKAIKTRSIVNHLGTVYAWEKSNFFKHVVGSVTIWKKKSLIDEVRLSAKGKKNEIQNKPV